MMEKTLEQELVKLRGLIDQTNLTNDEVVELLVKNSIPVVQPVATSESIEDKLQGISNELKQLRNLVAESRCQIRTEGKDAILGLCFPPGSISGDNARKYLQDKLSGCRDLTIVDPYIFSVPKDTDAYSYSMRLIDMIPSGTEKIDIFYNRRRIKNRESADEVRNKIDAYALKNNIQQKQYSTKMIHDRAWIKDRSIGIAVGASFNGFGKGLTFALEVPTEDLNILLDVLDEIITHS